jgi:hypothetical protein
MKEDISKLVLMANTACKEIVFLSANASSMDLDKIEQQNAILKLVYTALQKWINEQR